MELNKKYFNHRKWQFHELPDLIMIETVMGCNLRCEMCPVPRSKLLMNGRLPTMMSMETFRKILDDIADKPRSLHLNQMGEPLLNRSIVEFVLLAKKDGHRVSFTTNGTLMDDTVARALLSAGIDRIIFSIDGYTAKTYESIRIGASYETVRATVEHFCRLRKELGQNTIVEIDCIVSDLTRNEIAPMQKYWRDTVDRINAIPLDDWAGKYALPSKFGPRNWNAKTSSTLRYPCDLLWTTLSISAEGFVMYCCHDYQLLSKLPNVNEQSLRHIWKDYLSKERRKHVEGRIDADPCAHCDAWKTRAPYFRQPSFVQNVANGIPVQCKSAIKKFVARIKDSVTHAPSDQR